MWRSFDARPAGNIRMTKHRLAYRWSYATIHRYCHRNFLHRCNLEHFGMHGSGCGTIDNNGLYTPTPVPSDATVNVVATLQSDTSRSGSAQVNQVP